MEEEEYEEVVEVRRKSESWIVFCLVNDYINYFNKTLLMSIDGYFCLLFEDQGLIRYLLNGLISKKQQQQHNVAHSGAKSLWFLSQFLHLKKDCNHPTPPSRGFVVTLLHNYRCRGPSPFPPGLPSVIQSMLERMTLEATVQPGFCLSAHCNAKIKQFFPSNILLTSSAFSLRSHRDGARPKPVQISVELSQGFICCLGI